MDKNKKTLAINIAKTALSLIKYIQKTAQTISFEKLSPINFIKAIGVLLNLLYKNNTNVLSIIKDNTIQPI